MTTTVGGVVKTGPRESEGPGNVDTRYIVAAARKGIIGLEEAADALLAAHGALGRENGIYTEAQLNRKFRQEARRLPEMDEASLSEDTINYITGLQLRELAELAELTPMQDVCYRLHCEGLSTRQMSELTGVSGQVVWRHLRKARQRIKQACREGRFAGWYRIYLSEISRRGYKQRHGGGPYTSNRP